MNPGLCRRVDNRDYSDEVERLVYNAIMEKKEPLGRRMLNILFRVFPGLEKSFLLSVIKREDERKDHLVLAHLSALTLTNVPEREVRIEEVFSTYTALELLNIYVIDAYLDYLIRRGRIKEAMVIIRKHHRLLLDPIVDPLSRPLINKISE